MGWEQPSPQEMWPEPEELHSEYSSWQCQRCQSQDMTQAARSQSQLNPPYCGLCTWSERIFWIQSRLKKDKFIEARDTISAVGLLSDNQGEPTLGAWSCLFLQPKDKSSRSGSAIRLLTCCLVGEEWGLRIHLLVGWGHMLPL